MKLAASVSAYALAILTANYLTASHGLVPVGFGLLVTAGTFSAGLALLARDFVHRYGGLSWAVVAIAAGGLMSWLLASPALAIASTVAFVGAEAVDLAIFAPLHKRVGFALAALASNVVSAPVDTILFLHLAGFGVTTGAVGGQFVGKVVWATLIPLALWMLARAVLRKPEHA